jgi:muramoyltetrapeptide carboxypeptidase LdcA involved in peptidoglycan recycling
MGKRELEQRFGFTVREMPHALKEPEWVLAHPEHRAEDLRQAFADPAIDGIIASIGGDDAIRLLPYLDTAVIGPHPKVFLGYSDTTTLHLASYLAGLQTFYGPSVMAGIAENGGMFDYTERWFRKVLMSPEPVGTLQPATEWTEEHLTWSDPALENRRRTLQKSTGWVWLQGESRAQGHLLGGCLDTLERVKETAWWPSLEAWRGAVFFWETSENAPTPHAVRGWLQDYASRGILDVIAGMCVGRPRSYSDAQREELYTGLRDLVGKDLGRPNIPIVAEMDFGHTDPMLILPVGGLILLDPVKREVVLPEAAVR